jgi:L-2,4-diaminobutyrate decarboxylase
VTARRSRGLATDSRAVVVASADAHVSMAKALAVMGLPPEALCPIAVDGDGRLIPEELDQELERLEQAGRPVIAVVATAGTTVRGAVDPLVEMADLCASRRLWLHVDGAIGAVFALVPAHRFRVAGLERADSITINPQKLLGITKTSSLLLLAQPQALAQAFQTGLPYMEPSWGGSHGGETGLQGTRPAEVLKLWLGLRQLGLSGIGAVLDGAIQRRRQLQALLTQSERLELRSGMFHLLAFTPSGLDAAAAAVWSQQTRQLLLQHQLMLSRPHYGGRHHLKAVLGNPHTRSTDLETLATLVQASLEALP